MFVIALLIILASAIVYGIIYFVWSKPRALWVDSMPTDNYVEASFDNWLDWFMIAPDKWRFEKEAMAIIGLGRKDIKLKSPLVK